VWRRAQVGIVFQQSNWIKSLNVVENVEYPLYLTNLNQGEIRQRAMGRLSQVGMEKMADKKPMDLSGGEQQKVSLARALVIDPKIIVADEPTGNLDSKSSQDLIGILANLNREERKTIIMVTHDASFLPWANRRVFMKDGAIVNDEHD
jgi:putative ABC transport system ATP-binding protein